MSNSKAKGDEQIIMGSLATYYEEHGQSFDRRNIPEYLRGRFEKYSGWAKAYYEEWVILLWKRHIWILCIRLWLNRKLENRYI